jgi:hypothetical protein
MLSFLSEDDSESWFLGLGSSNFNKLVHHLFADRFVMGRSLRVVDSLSYFVRLLGSV